MARHASWKGFLKISLVNIPVQAYTASAGKESSELSLHQLHETCKSRIQYKKFCPIHGEVSNDEIVSGFEYTKGKYAVLDKEEIAKLGKDLERAMTIDAFVPPDKIDPVYFAGQSYYLLPDGKVGEKPYSLIREALESNKLCGIGEIVLSRKQRLVRLRATKKLLVFDTLHYAGELKESKDFDRDVKEVSANTQESKLTNALIEQLSQPRFEPENYVDDYMEQMQKLIADQVKGKHVAEVPEEEEPQVINFVEALQRSMKAVRSPAQKSVSRKSKPAAKRKSAPHKKPAKRARKTG